MSDRYQAALDYGGRGWPVAPITPGGKSPTIDDWPVRATVDPKLIAQWWMQRWPEAGVGIITGTRSGLLVLDVDISPTKRGDDSLADLEATFGPLPATVEVITGSGGRHLYFKLPTDEHGRYVEVDSSAGRLGLGLDIRCEGGQVLAPPTVHPDGGVYQWEASSHPDDVELATAPQWLIDELTTMPEGMEITRAPRERPEGAVTPGDIYDAEADPAKVILEMAGGVYLGKRKDRQTGTEYHLIGRPPMPDEHDWKPHVSATWDYRGGGALKVFSDGWMGANPETGEVWRFKQDGTYTLFGVLATCRFGGVFAAAASALTQKRITTATTEWMDTVMVEEHPDDDWAEPVHFDEGGDLDPWPIDIWPDWLVDEMRACADALQVADDMPSVAVWFLFGVLCAGKVDVVASPSFMQPTNVMTCGVAPSGGSKSPVMKRMLDPLIALELDLQTTAAASIRESEARRRKLEADLKRANQAIDKGEHGAESLWISASEALDTHQDVLPPRLLASDVTPEKLEELMATHGQRMGLMSTEGAEVLSSMTGARYKAGAELARVPPVFLKGFDGDPIKTDRLGRDQVLMERPLLSVGIYLQPSVVDDLVRHPQMVRQGGLGRLLWNWQRDNVGERDMSRWVDATPASADYRDRIIDLGRRMSRWQNPKRVPFTADAQSLAVAWFDTLENRHRFGNDLAVDAVKESAQKMRGYLVRCSGILAVAHGEEEVSAARLEDAIRFLDVAVTHLTYTLDRAGSTEGGEAVVRLVATWLSNHAGEEVEVGDIRNAFRRRFDSVLELRPVLYDLLERRWIRLIGGSLGDIGQRGKVNPKIAVNPLVDRNTRVRVRRAREGSSEGHREGLKNLSSCSSDVGQRSFSRSSSSSLETEEASDRDFSGSTRDVHELVDDATTTDEGWETFR